MKIKEGIIIKIRIEKGIRNEYSLWSSDYMDCLLLFIRKRGDYVNDDS